MTPAKFRALVWRFYRVHGRHELPWRKTRDVYRVLVSEVMLQQTQVERVILFYKSFIQKFPTAKSLSRASLADVLKAWQGLGYNRRAKMLHAAAKELAATSRFDLEVAELEKLPGVGPYTAGAVAAFASNTDCVVIETNIRTAIIHHFFSNKEKVSDKEIEKVLVETLPIGRAREWYSALMDYGAHLKRSGISHNARSATHTGQSKFAGSLREVRGAILRKLTESDATLTTLKALFADERHEQVMDALDALVREKLLVKKGRRYALAE